MKTHLLPKISIITPSFNQGEYLEETILSVLNQNYTNLEYIVMDGNSTDISIDTLKKHRIDVGILLKTRALEKNFL